MYESWYSRINLENKTIMIVSNKNCWERVLEYRCIGQTQSAQSDINPEGTEKTRKLAKKLLSLGDVRGVRLWKNTVLLTISSKASKKNMEYISLRAMEILAQSIPYGYWRTSGR